jgi:hypothetical protein
VAWREDGDGVVIIEGTESLAKAREERNVELIS